MVSFSRSLPGSLGIFFNKRKYLHVVVCLHCQRFQGDSECCMIHQNGTRAVKSRTSDMWIALSKIWDLSARSGHNKQQQTMTSRSTNGVRAQNPRRRQMIWHKHPASSCKHTVITTINIITVSSLGRMEHMRAWFISPKNLSLSLTNAPWLYTACEKIQSEQTLIVSQDWKAISCSRDEKQFILDNCLYSNSSPSPPPGPGKGLCTERIGAPHSLSPNPSHPSPSWLFLDQGMNLAWNLQGLRGVCPPAWWEEQSTACCWHCRGPVLLPPPQPAEHISSCREGLLALFQTPAIVDSDSDTRVNVETVLRSAPFPVCTCACVYISALAVLVLTGGQPPPVGTHVHAQTLSEWSCSLRWDGRQNFSPKANGSSGPFIISTIFSYIVHAAAILAGRTTISPALHHSSILLSPSSFFHTIPWLKGEIPLPCISPEAHFLCLGSQVSGDIGTGPS